MQSFLGGDGIRSVHSDNHDAKQGVRSGPEQQAGKEWSDVYGCVLHLNNARRKNRESL
ncbi:MAG: hypothetical protein ABSE07_01150 [Methanoregula sp.]|jgi:hypothetical protein